MAKNQNQMSRQTELEELLRKKGIGPQRSKSLNAEEVLKVKDLIKDPEVSITTKATMLTALLTLEPNEYEKILINEIHSKKEDILPELLIPMVTDDNSNVFTSLVKKSISLSDLSETEAETAMRSFFDPAQPEFLKASFLEAQRLKRETFTENKVFFESLWQHAKRKEIQVPKLIHICDTFDGHNRTRNYSVFTAALLASAGFKVLLTGIDSVAPKFGISHHQILKTASKNPVIEIERAEQELLEIGWTYLDQSIFLPELYQLKNMRKEMVKRPFLATFEKLLQPIRSIEDNYIVTGYTHAHYKEELVKQLQAQNKCSQAIVLKGMEGGTHLNMTRDTVCVHYNGSTIIDDIVNPAFYNLQHLEEKQDKQITADAIIKEGLDALNGEKNFAWENIIYLAAVILDKFGLMEKKEASEVLTNCIKNNYALATWKNKI